jgi:predicted ABC-type ATPase
MSKCMYILAGCNGAGKTTASKELIPAVLKAKTFVNADEIAYQLSLINLSS